MRRSALVLALALTLLTTPPVAADSSTPSPKKKAAVSDSAGAKKQMSGKKTTRRTTGRKRKTARRAGSRYRERFTTSSFVEDATEGDITAGEDPVVRAAAVEALGNLNGTVVAVDPNSGRVLAMVNQKLALSEGAQPCSTIKVAIALAALSEGIVTKDTPVRLGKAHLNLTSAMSRSNNPYFEALGRKMGFEKVAHYAQQFGLGELAGWDIEGEHLGEFPTEELAANRGGVGRMSSFGEGISMTSLQLGAMMSALANGGTLYYLQHPRSAEEVANFRPVVKRELDIAPLIPEVSEGLIQAVETGTGRSVRYSFSEEEVLGKTGTCSNSGTRYGWFTSYANTEYGRIVLVVFLRGGWPVYGPKAAEISGKIYRALYDRHYFATRVPKRAETASEVGVSQ